MSATKMFVALLIGFAGFLLRFLMLRSEKSLWGDEWYSIELAQKSIQEIFANITQDPHPPFFYAALHFLVKGLGFQEWVFRLIPFCAGVGTVFLVYLLGRRITRDIKSGLLAAFLVALSPYWLQLSNEIRSYSLLGFVSCLGTLLFVQLAEGRRTGWAKTFYVLTAVSVVYLEHYGLFWLFGIVVYTVYLTMKSSDDRSLLGLQAMVLILCLPSLGLTLYQALYTEPVFHLSRISSYYALAPLLKKIIAVFWHFACGPTFSMLSSDRVFHYIFQSAPFWTSFTLMIVLLGLCIESLVGFARKRRDVFILLALLLFFPILCLLILYPVRLHSRYLTFAAPYFFILVGNAFAKEEGRKWRVVLLFILAGSYLYTDYNFIKMKTDPIHREDYPTMIRYTFEKAGPEDAICGFLLGPETVPYYEHRLKLRRRAAYFNNCDQLSRDPSATKFNKIWLMGYMDMDEKTNVRNMAYFQQHFGKAGFISMRRVENFGGEDGLNSVYVFEKSPK